MTRITLNAAHFIKGKPSAGAPAEHTEDAPSGYYVVQKGAVFFYDFKDEPIAVINAHGVFGCATRIENGAIWYNFATPRIIGAFPSYGDERRQVEKAFKTAIPTKH